ncbi:MAG: MFS transporter [Rhodospirillaceae bacterium]|nr:MFS transporter [Rhodospirillaceae bacterium]
MASASKITARRLAAYSIPAFALAMPTIPAFVYLPALYAESLGLATAGLILLGARIIDVISDPIVGVLSDRHKTRWGHRKPWIFFGALLAGFALVRLFQPPIDVNAPYLFVWAIMLYIGWTLIAVPYTAWGAELSDDYDQRSKITGAREGLTLIGILAAGAIPALTASIGWTEAEGLSAVSWLAIIVGAPAIAIMLLWLPEPDISGRQAPQQRMTWASTKHALAIISSNKPFVRLLSAWFINGMANGIPAALFLLYLEYGLGADAGQRSILILAYFLSGVLSIPVWLKVSNRIGKHRAWCWAMVLTCLAFACVPFLSPGDLAIFTAICIVTGTGLGADLSLPPALQADVIDFDRLRSGKARAGLFFALWSMSTKMALALAVGITFPALELLGFTTDSENSLSTLWSLSVIYAWVPVVLKIVAIALIWTFPITRERQELIRRRLERRYRQPT